MQLGDHLGFAGIVLGLIGIGVTIMWPTKRWIGVLCLVSAGLVLVIWGVKAYRESHSEQVQDPLFCGERYPNKWAFQRRSDLARAKRIP